MAASTRVHLYGVSLELPPGWIDQTSYLFESAGAPLRSVAFAREAIPVARAEGWLLGKARTIVESFERARVGPIQRYSNPEFHTLGFEVEFGEAGRTRCAALVVVARDEGGLTIVAKGDPGYLEYFHVVVASLRMDAFPPAVGRYPVYDYSFESRVPLRTPQQFAFVRPDRSASLSCEWVDSKPVFGESEWLQPFGLPLDATVTVQELSESLLVGRSNERLGLSGPLIEQRRTLALAVLGLDEEAFTDAQQESELYFGEARAGRDTRHFHLMIANQGSFATGRAIWRGLLSSMSWED